MNLYVVMDADNAGKLVGRAALADEPAELSRLSHNITDASNRIIAWAQQHGGSAIAGGGDEVYLEIPAELAPELPKARQIFYDLTGFTISVGVAPKLSDASRALLVAKMRGKDRIVWWDPDMKEELDEHLKKLEGRSEAEKLNEEYLQKAEKAALLLESQKLLKSNSLSDQFAGVATAQQAQAQEQPQQGSQPQPQEQAPDQQQPQDDSQNVKGAVLQILQEVKAQIPTLEKLKQVSPDTYQAVAGMVQAMMMLAEAKLAKSEALAKEEERRLPPRDIEGLLNYTVNPNVWNDGAQWRRNLRYILGDETELTPDQIDRLLAHPSTPGHVLGRFSHRLSDDQFDRAFAVGAKEGDVSDFMEDPRFGDKHWRMMLEGDDPYLFDGSRGRNIPRWVLDHIVSGNNEDARKAIVHRDDLTEDHIAKLIDGPGWSALDAMRSPHARLSHVVNAPSRHERDPNRMADLVESFVGHWPERLAEEKPEVLKGALDILNNASRSWSSYKKTIEEAVPPESLYQRVNVTTGTNKLRQLRDVIQAAGGSMLKRDLEKRLGIQWPKQFNSILGPKGEVSADTIDQFIKGLPSTPFTVSHSEWGGAQRHNSDDSKVLRINLTNDHIQQMKDAGVYDTYRKWLGETGGHPIGPHSVGWIRYTGDHDNGLFVDEVQTDLGRSPGDQLEAHTRYTMKKNLLARRRDQTLTPEEQVHIDNHATNARQYLDNHYPPEHFDAIKKIVFGDRNPTELLHETFHQWARDSGFAGVPIAIHSPESKKAVVVDSSHMAPDDPVPAHFLDTYNKIPRSMGMAQRTYGKEGTTETAHHLAGMPVHEDVIRKSESISCKCEAYRFPHRLGGGKCKAKELRKDDGWENSLNSLPRSERVPDLASLKATGSGNHLGGAGEKTMFSDDKGNQYLFRHAVSKFYGDPEPFRAAGQVAVSGLQQRLKPFSPALNAGIYGDSPGVIQQFVPGKPFGTRDPSSLSDQEKEDLAAEHIIDWVTAQHDSHPDNLITTPDGRLVGIDKEQAFRWFGGDRLDTEFHPNAQYGAAEPFYNTFWRDYGQGKVNFDPKVMDRYFDLLDQYPDEEYAQSLAPYATLTGRGEDFVRRAVERKRGARQAFGEFFKRLRPLDKSAMSPNKTMVHHPVNLDGTRGYPPSQQLDGGRIKVMHSDMEMSRGIPDPSKLGWRQMRAGVIMDSDGSPLSSRRAQQDTKVDQATE